MKITQACLFPALLFVLLFSFSKPAAAHSPEQSNLYLRIYKDAIGGRLEVTTTDLNRVLGLNLNDDLTMEELQPHILEIQAYLLDNIRFGANDQNYPIRFTETSILNLNYMPSFAKFAFSLDDVEQVPKNLDIAYHAFLDERTHHQGLCIIEYNWKAGVINNESLISLIFSPGKQKQQLSLTDASLWKGFMALLKLGVWHIWIGLDHILFILALILPAVVRRKELVKDPSMVISKVGPGYSDSWLPVSRFRPAFIYIITVITFFTIAHSITLALAALGVVDLNSRLVESIIALSIALAAYHNIRPVFKGREWVIAFVFGLFHGFGFASVLGEKGLSGDYLVLSLLGFNLGVEVGQVLIICLIFPFLFLMRRWNIYPKIITYGSFLLILIALYWTVERAFDIDLTLGKYVKMAYRSIASLFG